MIARRALARLRRSGPYRRLRERASAWGRDATAKAFYGQYAEDACLFSYFADRQYALTQDLSRIGKGFYVDVGAYDPESISNTRVFYKAGWRGINIDPSQVAIAKFERERPEDINLHCAVSDQEGPITFYSFGQPSVYSTVDQQVAADYARRLGAEPRVETVAALSLATILDRHLAHGTAIDFLSVDAEGHDVQVLQSNDWNRHRPELVVAELHERDLEAVTASPLTAFMHDVGYTIRFWSPPSIIFIDRRREGL